MLVLFIRLSSARTYIDVGLQLLDAQHWRLQYELSLRLHEMSASISFMQGDTNMMSSEILSHTKTFDDSLKATSLRIKLLASQTKFEDAISNCLVILSDLGEEIPLGTSLPSVLNELSIIRASLTNLSHEEVKLLPRMGDGNKLTCMKMLNLLSQYSIISKPMLLPVVSVRMVRITLEYGFCEDSIVVSTLILVCFFSFSEIDSY